MHSFLHSALLIKRLLIDPYNLKSTTAASNRGRKREVENSRNSVIVARAKPENTLLPSYSFSTLGFG